MLEARIAAKRLASGEVLLRDVAVAASPGAVVALLGASGTGKTSILRILLGLDRAFEGTVRCEASRVGALFQEPRLLPWRTVGDNIRLVVPGRDHAPDIAALLGSVGLAAGVEELYPRQLSLGMARRASLARALAAAPELLVLDEPFASLDPGSAGVVAARIALAAQGGVAVVIALHDVARAAALATSIVVLAGRPATVACQVDIAAHALVPERARVQEDLVQRFPFLSDGPEREGQGALPHDPAIG